MISTNIIVKKISDQINVIGNEMSVYISRFANVWSQIKHICVLFKPVEVVGRGSETQLQNLNVLS